MRAALVLAGGRSTRFGGTDKALADVDGAPMIRRVVERVGDGVDDVVVNCREGQRGAIEGALAGCEYSLAVDPVPDEGPVAGMRTGLRVASAPAVAVVGCDMPRVDPTLLERLFDARGTAAVPRADGRLHPLHGVYDRYEARVACDRTLATGSRRLYDVLSRLDPVTVDVEAVPDVDAGPFVDVDTRADLATVTDHDSS